MIFSDFINNKQVYSFISDLMDLELVLELNGFSPEFVESQESS
jgi:hypothetical protein